MSPVADAPGADATCTDMTAGSSTTVGRTGVSTGVSSRTATFPLTDRRTDDILFRTRSGPITTACFIVAARRLAARLPMNQPAARPDGDGDTDDGHTYVINLCQDRARFALVFAACLLRGQVSLLTSDRSEVRLRSLAARFGATCSVSDDPDIASPLPGHLVLPPDLFDGPFEDAPPGEDMAGPVPEIPAAQLAAIVFTSGSTGEPVGNRKFWGALAQRSRAAGLRFGLSAATPTSIVGTVPPQHMYGLEATVLLPLHAAASVWCGPAFYPGDVDHALADLPAPRLLVTTPLQLRALLTSGLTPPSLATIISATAPLYPDLAGLAETRWQTKVHEIYGATEAGSIATRRTIEGDLWTPYDGVRLVRQGEDICVVAAHADPAPLNDQVAFQDGDARFRLLGRKSDLIKLAGKRASLAGLNKILNEIDGVEDGLFVAPDDLDSQPTGRLLAFVIAPDRSAEDILAALRQQIDPTFLPRRVVRVSSLPRNAVGKLTRSALAELRAATLDS